jgi:primosomal protein N' (replication factor Y)
VAGGAVDIIVGTQLVTKGYHFPELTLVGVVDADLGLDGGDLRAAERTFQQITQVAGRAGRGEKPGRVLIQTHAPETPVMQAILRGDEAAFYAAETAGRRAANAPPFGRFAAIIVSDTDAALAQETARRLGRAAPRRDGLEVYGPAEAPLAVLRGRHRWRLLVHARRTVELQAILREWLAGIDWKASTRVSVDVDPYSFV